MSSSGNGASEQRRNTLPRPGTGAGRTNGRGVGNIRLRTTGTTSSLTSVRPPRRQATPSLGERARPIGDYIPQQVVASPPHINDTQMNDQPQQEQDDWDITGLFRMLNDQGNGNGNVGIETDDIVPDSQVHNASGEAVERDRSPEHNNNTDSQTPSNPVNASECGQRPQRQILRGGSSTRGGVDEEHPIEDDRPFIIPAGDDSFDPSACIKRIGMECIGAYFKVGWTTLETCDRDAVDKWFEHFKCISSFQPCTQLVPTEHVYKVKTA